MDNHPLINSSNNNVNHVRQNVTNPNPNDLGNAGVQQALDALLVQSRGIRPSDIANFMEHLELLMQDCSQANIQAGKNWVVNHCQTPQQYDLLSRALVAISISRNSFNDKLHIVYLTNDILSHSERKQQRWIKDAFFPHLVPILRVAYYFPGIDDSQRQRVMKVLDIWRSKDFFPSHLVDTMEADVRRPPLLPPHQSGGPIQGQAPFPQLHHPQHLIPAQQQQQQQQQQRHHPMNFGPWPQHIGGPHQQFPPHLSPQQPFGQSIVSPTFQPTQPLQPGFHHQIHPPHQQQPHVPYHQPPTQGNFHVPFQPPVGLNLSAPSLPPPAPTHRDVLARDLPAAQMMSKIESDADYYKPLPAYVSVPIQKNTHFNENVLKSLREFLSEDADNQLQGDGNVQDEGWHEGHLADFYKTTAEKRKWAFSKDKKSSRQSRSRHRGDDDKGDSGSRRRPFDSRSRSRSRTRSRSRSMSRSRSRDRSRSYTRSRSRSRSVSRSRSPPYRRKDDDRSRNRSRSRSVGRGRTRSRSMDRDKSGTRGRSTSQNLDRRRGRSPSEEQYPTRSFAGLGSNTGQSSLPYQYHNSQQQQQKQQQQQSVRPMFQPARYA